MIRPRALVSISGRLMARRVIPSPRTRGFIGVGPALASGASVVAVVEKAATKMVLCTVVTHAFLPPARRWFTVLQFNVRLMLRLGCTKDGLRLLAFGASLRQISGYHCAALETCLNKKCTPIVASVVYEVDTVECGHSHGCCGLGCYGDATVRVATAGILSRGRRKKWVPQMTLFS